jgi:hypothetical protein
MKAMTQFLLKSSLAVLLLVQLTIAVPGQSNVVLKGRIEDPAGMAIPEVHISLSGKSGLFQAVSDENGQFEINIPAGVYKLTSAKVPGFAATKKKKLLVKATGPVILKIRPKIDLSTADCVLRVTSN